jgi:competence protein ComEC
VAWALAAVVLAAPAPSAIPPGSYNGPVTLLGEVVEGRFGPWAIGSIEDGPVLVVFEEHPGAGRGDQLLISGGLSAGPGTAGGRQYGAVLRVRKVDAVQESPFLLHRAGKLVARTVESRLQPYDDGRALLAGFLIGDTSRIAEADVDAMRRSGLAHFVAVSGSNVALFLALLAFAAGPLALGPKRRALLGLAALPVYVAATRFEPSVVRAAFMAGVALGGRLLGVVLEAWQLLSFAVAALVIVDPALTSNVGFQLSVAATAGVLVGARWPLGVRAMRPLAVTLGAQLAVAPLLLVHFGTVPLLSPAVNLAAAPMVALSTVVGAVGVAGVEPLVSPAGWVADAVLTLARGSAPWPQLGGFELGGLVLAALTCVVLPRARPVVVSIAAAGLLFVIVDPGGGLQAGEVVVLDVGQGDAILIHGGEGRFALVDGGPEESEVVNKLRRYGVRSLDLMVLTHVHADHATGLIGVLDAFPVEEAWMSLEPHSTSASEAVVAGLGERRIPVVDPEVGTRFKLGHLTLIVEGPLRRYASPNDQSLVITVVGPGRTMLLSGDIETHAQADLAHLEADVLKVPHQGAATSDAGWLGDVGSALAVISVGPNQFGHPVEWVIDVLDDSNQVVRTDELGDVVVDLMAADDRVTVGR